MSEHINWLAKQKLWSENKTRNRELFENETK